MNNTLKVLDLFSGIGGFSLGLERAGMETVAFCEIEEYPRKLLKKHWPDVPIYNDVRKLKGDELGTIDVICGGFPCQPFSVAGKQKGKEDNRHLWPEMFRLIQECRPRWVIGENVAGFIRMALDDVLLDLEAEGYSTRTFVIPACAVGGIHRRDRVWIVAERTNVYDTESVRCDDGSDSQNIRKAKGNVNTPTVPGEQPGREGVVAHSESNGRGERNENERNENETGCVKRTGEGEEQGFGDGCGIMADTISEGLQGSKQPGTPGEKERPPRPVAEQSYAAQFTRPEFQPIGIPTQPELCMSDDGFSGQLVRGFINESESIKKRPVDILSAMFNEDGTQEIWREIGRFNAVQIKKILLEIVHGNSKKIKDTDEKIITEISEKAQKILLRALQHYRKAINSSCGWGLEEQQSGEFNDSLQFVSHHVASFAGRYEFKWIKIPSESTVRDRNDMLPDNVARLKALGNAVVPQIPEMIGRAILSVSINEG